jgi:ribosome-associated translation inhibitor RaiA
MFVDTRAMGFPLTDAIRRYVESRARSSLAAVRGWIVAVTVRLSEVKVDRGGIDKRCKVAVALRRRGVVIAEATDVDLCAAIDSATGRLRRAARESVRRMIGRDRKDHQRPRALLGA